MNFCICVKQVPDVTAPVAVRNGELVFDAARMVLNAYDASAVEAALTLVEKVGGETTIVTVGDDSSKEAVRKALAMGADRGMHLSVPVSEKLDSFAYARILSDYLSKTEFDYILCGKQAQDTDAGLTGSMIASMLNIPYLTNAIGIEVSPGGGSLIVKRQGDAGQEIFEVQPGALITCSNDMNEPRIPNVKGIMLSKKKPLTTMAVSFDSSLIRTTVTAYHSLPERKPGTILKDDAPESVRHLVNLLTEEAKVI